MRRSIALTAVVALALPAAACRKPELPHAGDFRVPATYAALFKPFAHWSYNAGTVGPGNADEPTGSADEAATGVVVKCQVESTKPFRGGVASKVRCDTPTAMVNDTGPFPLEGVWMANDVGLWHVHRGASPSLDNATLVLLARPEEGRMSPDVLTADDSFAEVAKDGDAWCTTHRQVMDGETYFTVCFAPEGVRSGRYGWKEDAVHETRFELAR
jgi:hypothetical protein